MRMTTKIIPLPRYWVDTSQMLADVLTRIACDRDHRDPLLKTFCNGEWQLQPPEEAKDCKLMIQAGRHARKAKAKLSAAR